MEATYQHIIKEELARRCERNPRYSIRAFAKALQIDVGALSRVLAGKQIPSHKLAQKLIEALELEPEKSDVFVSSISETQGHRHLRRTSPFFKKLQSKSVPQDLSIDLYRVIADWYHVAILELTFVEDFESTPRWISKNLGIGQTEARLAIERLLNLGLLATKNGRLIKTTEQLSTADKHLTTPALKKNQRQFLERAMVSLEEDPIEERSITSMTMAIDPAKLNEAKKMIREFNQTLCQFLESGKQKRVYNLGVALCPVQKKES